MSSFGVGIDICRDTRPTPGSGSFSVLKTRALEILKTNADLLEKAIEEK
jgi:hypothetical protein